MGRLEKDMVEVKGDIKSVKAYQEHEGVIYKWAVTMDTPFVRGAFVSTTVSRLADTALEAKARQLLPLVQRCRSTRRIPVVQWIVKILIAYLRTRKIALT